MTETNIFLASLERAQILPLVDFLALSYAYTSLFALVVGLFLDVRFGWFGSRWLGARGPGWSSNRLTSTDFAFTGFPCHHRLLVSLTAPETGQVAGLSFELFGVALLALLARPSRVGQDGTGQIILGG